jgi:TRAP-type C4-dicarboxylate transport system permease small subunit
MTTKRQKEDQNLWNFIFSLFFLAVFVWAMWEIWGETGTFPHAISLFDVTLMAFAAFRITRLMVYDKITRWFRELFADVREYEEHGVTWVEVRPWGSGFRHTIYDLLGCPWCIGFWSSLIIVFCYYMFPWAWVVLLFLAVAGAGSLLQLIANAVGWRAENLKLDAKSKEDALRELIDRSSIGK